MFTNINFNNVGPGTGDRGGAARRGREDRRARRRRDHEGLRARRSRKADGTRLKIDDPELDPIWQTRAAEHSGLHPHRRSGGVLPADRLQNERWLELALYPDRRYPASQFPTFEDLMAERDDLFAGTRRRRSSRRTWGGTRTIWRGSARCSTRCRTCTPSSARCSTTSGVSRARARVHHQVPGPRSVRQGQLSAGRVPVLLARLRDRRRVLRLLPRLPRVLEAVRAGPAGQVLRKLYYQNALKLVPGIPRAGFPT